MIRNHHFSKSKNSPKFARAGTHVQDTCPGHVSGTCVPDMCPGHVCGTRVRDSCLDTNPSVSFWGVTPPQDDKRISPPKKLDIGVFSIWVKKLSFWQGFAWKWVAMARIWFRIRIGILTRRDLSI